MTYFAITDLDGKSFQVELRTVFAESPTPDVSPVSAAIQNRINRLALGVSTQLVGDEQLRQLRDVAERFSVSGLVDWSDVSLLERLEAEVAVAEASKIGECRIHTGRFFRVWREDADEGKLPDILIAAVPGAGTIPQDYLDFKIAVDRTSTVISILHDRRTRWTSVAAAKRCAAYQDTLFQLAAVGLGQDQVLLAALALDRLQSDMVDRESGPIKNEYLRSLGAASLLFAALALGAYAILRTDGGIENLRSLAQLRSFFPLAAGAALGAWFSFAIRRTGMTFRSLAVIEEDRLDPAFRVAFVVGLSVVVGLFFWTGTVSITIGSFSTNFRGSGTTAVLIGLLCGIGEMGLGSSISARASDFVSRVGIVDRARA